MANVQINETLFKNLVRYVLFDDPEVLQDCKEGLNDKIEAMVRRELYSKYKGAETAEDREKARIEYLDRIGIHEEFRW